MHSLPYDTATEVTAKQYRTVIDQLGSYGVAGRVVDGKHYIKLWCGVIRKDVLQILKHN